MYKPELLASIKGYNSKKFFQDFTAGIIVAIVALPLSIAFAIASGCSPETGLYTAIIAGYCISAFGGTKVQIGGPTGAFTVIIYAIVNNPNLGFAGLATATVLAGIMLILLGAFKLGGLVKFIPYTIVVGFTAGIAVTIATGQIGDFFGLTPQFPIVAFGSVYEKMPGTFVGKILIYANSLSSINIYSFLMALVSLILLFVLPKFTKKIPASLIVIALATLANLFIDHFFNLKTTLIGDLYKIPDSLPKPMLPDFSINTIKTVFPSAISIALLAAIESLLSAVVADGMTGSKHDSNNELIGQGIANIFSPIFGGLPATGAIARTATNINNGGKTPIAGIVHALTLLFIMIFFGKYVQYIPLASLAAILIQVAWNMAGLRAIRSLLKGQKSDTAVLLVTFLITVFIDLTYAIGIGLVFAAFLFIKKMIDLSTVSLGSPSLAEGLNGEGSTQELTLPKQVLVYEIDGPLFFGTVRKFEYATEVADADIKVIIFRMKNTLYLDAGGIIALEQVKNACGRKDITIILSGLHKQPYLLCKKMGIVEIIGRENIFANIDSALKRAEEILTSK
ncbi:SulP family inorganic anion transporter [Treponema pectinovorum]|uniref:SulP family inorganic anion transporter n=1 Tax=Treponema pectinovorum TaxID=164 RepID=UPI003D938556